MYIKSRRKTILYEKDGNLWYNAFHRTPTGKDAMLKEYRTQTILGVWGGFLSVGLGYLVSCLGSSYFYFGYAMMAGGYILLACGGYMYGRGKGYGWLVSFLGILGPLGLLILYVLRDRSARVLKKRRKEGLV